MSVITELTLKVSVVGAETLKELQADFAVLSKESEALTKSTLKYAAAMAKQGKGLKETSVMMAKIIGSFSKTAQEVGLTEDQMKTATAELTHLSDKGLNAAQRLEILQKAATALGVNLGEVVKGGTKAGEVAAAFAKEAGVAEQATKSLTARLKAQVVDLSNLWKWWVRIIMFWGVASLILQPVFQITNKLTEALFKEKEAILDTREALLELTHTSRDYLIAVAAAESGQRTFTQRLTGFFQVWAMVNREWATATKEMEGWQGALARAFPFLGSFGAALRLLKSDQWELATAMAQTGLQEDLLLKKTQKLADFLTGPFREATEETIKLIWEKSSTYEAFIATLLRVGLVEEEVIARLDPLTRSIAKLSIEIRELNEDYERNQERLENFRDMLIGLQEESDSFKSAVADLGKGLWRDLWDLAIRGADRLKDIWRDFRDALDDLQIETAQKIEDIWRDFGDAMEDLAIDIARRREDIEIKHFRKQRDLREKFQRDMKRLEERYMFDLIEAAIHRDAVSIRRIQRRYEFEKRQRAEQYREREQEERQNYEDDLEDLARYQERKAEDIARDRDRAFRDLEIEQERRREEIEKDRERAIRDLGESLEREERDIKKSYARQLADLKDAHKERRAEIVRQHTKVSALERIFQAAQKIQEWRHQRDILRVVTDGYREELNALEGHLGDVCRLEDGFTIDLVDKHTDRKDTLIKTWNEYFKWLRETMNIFGAALPPVPPLPGPPPYIPAGPWIPRGPIPSIPELQAGGQFLFREPTTFTARVAERGPELATFAPLRDARPSEKRLMVNVTVKGDGLMFSSAFEDELTNKITKQITKVIEKV